MFRIFDGNVFRNWKVLGLVLTAVLALASGVYAYLRYDVQPSTPYAVAVSPPLELRMELDKTEFQQGETIAIHLFLKNIGTYTTMISVPYIQHFVGFIVKDAQGTEIFNFPLGGFATVDEASLEPNGQMSKTLNWSQTGFLKNGDVIIGTYSALPGTYYIIGRTGNYLIDVDIATTTQPWTPPIQTPPIAITIS